MSAHCTLNFESVVKHARKMQDHFADISSLACFSNESGLRSGYSLKSAAISR